MIEENLNRIKSELPSGVKLVAVSKFHPLEAILEAYQAGQTVFGENRPQELFAKAQAFEEWRRGRGSDIRAIPLEGVQGVKAYQSASLMRSKYCIRYELGLCPKYQGAKPPQELFLLNNGRRLALRFDCAACEMTVNAI